MANHASHAALPYPVRGARYTIGIEYLSSTGVPTDPTTPDTEVSKDGGDYADAAEEVTTIVGSNGSGFITLSGAETDCALLMIAAKVASGPNNKLMTLYPRTLAPIYSGTASAGAVGSITLATNVPAVADLLIGAIVKTTGGTGGGGAGGANNQARVITDFTTGRIASVSPNWETAPDGTTTYEILLTEQCALRYANLLLMNGASSGAANATAFFDGTGYGVHPGRFTIANVGSQTSFDFGGGYETDNAYRGYLVRITDATAGEGGGVASSIRRVLSSAYDAAVQTITLESAPDFTINASDTIEFLPPSFSHQDYALVDTEVAAIKAKTDQLTFTGANRVDANMKAVDDDTAAAVNAESFFDGTGYGVHPGRFTIANVNSQTSFNFSGGYETDNAYRGYLVRITDPTGGESGGPASSIRVVTTSDYDAAVQTITIDHAPDFTITSGDIVEFLVPSFSFSDRTSIRTGTAQSGSASAIQLDSGASGTSDYYNGYLLLLIAGPGAGQAAFVQDYDGPTRMATMNRAWAVNPTSATKFVLHAMRIQHTGQNIDTQVQAGTLEGTLTAEAIDDVSAGVESQLDTRLLSADAKTRLDRSAAAIALGTVTTGANTTSIPTSTLDPPAAVTDQFKGRIMIFKKDTTTANLRGQAVEVTASTALGVLTVSPALTNAPASGDQFTLT